MTDPITPPTELVRQWVKQWREASSRPNDLHIHITAAAAQWGADQELEACCEWMRECGLHPEYWRDLRTARRPKPPSLKEQALEALNQADEGLNESEWQQRSETIRRALAQLND